ncbi:MAG: glycosyltransferase family 9 protein [Acidobacteria bacterium]|nr:glycosyltransferase family 9 protein [Acidobacteriota bacterium]MCB9377526.1 glycosyltransferase family 9 protein [Holophagales bacterium]
MRVLLIRTSALGDVVHALPVLSALRRSHPDAEIAWVVDEVFAPLLAGHESLDRRIVAPLRRARRRGARLAGARDTARFLRELRAFRADVALDLMGSHKGATIARLSGARRRIGLDRRGRREGSSALWINEPVAARGRHAVERMLALLAPLGVPEAPPDFAPERFACGRDHVPSGRYAYVHPGAAWGNKRYPAESWGRVAAALVREIGLEVRVGAAPGEEALADAAVAASAGAATRLDLPDLDSLAGALRGASVVLAGDTGALHLAAALGRPVVGLYGPTDPDRHGPVGVAEVLVERLPCSFCHRRFSSTKPCLRALEPERVASRAAALAAASTLD